MAEQEESATDNTADNDQGFFGGIISWLEEDLGFDFSKPESNPPAPDAYDGIDWNYVLNTIFEWFNSVFMIFGGGFKRDQFLFGQDAKNPEGPPHVPSRLITENEAAQKDTPSDSNDPSDPTANSPKLNESSKSNKQQFQNASSSPSTDNAGKNTPDTEVENTPTPKTEEPPTTPVAP